MIWLGTNVVNKTALKAVNNKYRGHETRDKEAIG